MSPDVALNSGPPGLSLPQEWEVLRTYPVRSLIDTTDLCSGTLPSTPVMRYDVAPTELELQCPAAPQIKPRPNAP